MMTVFRPSGTSSVTPSSTRLAPKAFVRASSWIMTAETAERVERKECTGVGKHSKPYPPSPPSQEHQHPERDQHQDRLAAEHHGAGGGLTHALGAARGVEAAEAAHQGHRRAEAGALDQAEPDVLEPVELLEALEELGGREIQQVDRGDPSGGDPD